MRFASLAWIGVLTVCVTATQVTPIPIEQLVSHADLVIRGTVLSKSCQRDNEGRIYTRVELSVAEVWKGTHRGSRIEIVHGGGTLGEERVLIPGQVDYRIGDDSVLFLVFNPRGEAVTLAMAQGKFDVSKESVSNETFVRNPFHGGFIGIGEGTSAVLNGSLTLAALRARVRGEEK